MFVSSVTSFISSLSVSFLLFCFFPHLLAKYAITYIVRTDKIEVTTLSASSSLLISSLNVALFDVVVSGIFMDFIILLYSFDEK